MTAMTAAGRHHAPPPMSGKLAVGVLGAVTGFDAVAATILLSGHGDELAAMGVIAGSVLAVTTTLCLYYAEKPSRERP